MALVYLAGNTAGALVPTPGGMGTIELALAGALTSITGINAGIATSIAVLFRVVTYWLRIPIGWVAMQYLQKTRRALAATTTSGPAPCGTGPEGRAASGQASALALSWSNSACVDRARVEERLRVGDVLRRRLARGDLTDVGVRVRLGLLDGLELPLRHALAARDDVDQAR